MTHSEKSGIIGMVWGERAGMKRKEKKEGTCMMTQKAQQKNNKRWVRVLRWKRNRCLGLIRKWMNRLYPKTKVGRTAATAVVTTFCTLAVTSAWSRFGNAINTEHERENLATAIRELYNPTQAFVCKECGEVAFIKTLRGNKIQSPVCVTCQKQLLDVTAFKLDLSNQNEHE